jgi:putative inorganic carbon (hco3(-)) transporter
MTKLNFTKVMSNEKSAKQILFISSAVFLAIHLVLVASDIYFFALLPFLIILGYLYFTKLDLVFFITVFLVPLSFEIKAEDFNLGLAIPAEPLLFGILVFVIFKILYEKPFSKQMLIHPITILIMIQMVWMFITSLTSQIPLVSFKFFLMQLWFVVPVFLFGQLIFNSKRKIYLFFILLIIPTVLTIIYTTIHHAMNGFSDKSGNWVMQPFYNDHTAYGATLAMILPVILGMAFGSKMSKYSRIYLMIAAGFVMLGIFLSFSRATWLSLILALAFFSVLQLNIKFRWILIAGFAVFGIIYLNYDNIMMKLEKNKQESSAHFVEHIQSISNIKTDASNLERINRWKAAMRMFEDHPVFGTGPGTYQFLYAPYQKSKDRTIISTNAGDMGNAHSEYITPLVERGIPGLLFFLGIIISVYITGIRTYKRIQDKEMKLMIALMLSGLFSYLMHGFMNNFLDTEKASMIFWGSIAIITRISIQSKVNDSENGFFENTIEPKNGN